MALALSACAHVPEQAADNAQDEGAWGAAMDADSTGDYVREFALLKPAAEHGYAPAQGALAIMYGLGEGVGKDLAEDMRLARMAAEQGDPCGESILGTNYETGTGVEKDYVRLCVVRPRCGSWRQTLD
jgi:TPR repeat protein